VIAAMIFYLKVTGKKVIDKSKLTQEELEYEKNYPLWRALTPWIFLVGIILILNIPQDIFNYLYRVLKMPIMGITANGAPLDTRALWNAYTWIFVSTLLAIPFLRPKKGQIKDGVLTWLKRAPRPVFSAAIFFAIGEVMNMAGYNMATKKFEVASMVKVLADYSSNFFSQMYGAVVSFIGLFGGFITGSEASTIAMFGKYTLTTSKNLNLGLEGMIVITAGLAFGGGLASVISPAKLQNAAAAIDKLGQENSVIRVAFVFSLILTTVTSLVVVSLLSFFKNG